LGVLPFVSPIAWPFAVAHAQHKRRAEKAVKPEDLTFKCVDVAGSRLYLVCMKPENAMAMGPIWGYIGLGTSVRYAEHLLKDIGTAKEVPFESIEAPPEPIAMPETDAHRGLKERVSQMMHRAAIDPEKVKCRPEDVYLYPNGMAAFFHLARGLLKYRPGWTVLVGQVYHDTRDVVLEQSQYGSKHFGKGDDKSLDELEAWLEGEAKDGHPVSFLFVEFPANPTLQVPDIPRLRKLVCLTPLRACIL
jgi:cystathionine gamma-synthase